MNPRAIECTEFYQGPTSKIPTATPIEVTTTSTEISAANSLRKHIILQNNGTQPVIIRLGTGAASTTTYNFTLSKSTAARDGLGGSITIKNYQGAIQGIVGASTTEIAVTEILKE